jgi:hypothetical protein
MALDQLACSQYVRLTHAERIRRNIGEHCSTMAPWSDLDPAAVY